MLLVYINIGIKSGTGPKPKRNTWSDLVQICILLLLITIKIL